MLHPYGARSVYSILVPCLLFALATQYALLGSTTGINLSYNAPPSTRIAILNIMSGKMDFSVSGLYQLSAVRNAIYAKLHGYSYVLVEDEHAVGSWEKGLWAKVANLPSVLKDFDLVVLMDFDVYINNITMPLEGLLDHWGFTHSHDLLLALDPDKSFNYVQLASNGTSVLNLNTGFMVVRSTPGMLSLWKEWYTYKGSEPIDQRAFNIYMRDKIPADKLVILPCKEANGGDPAWNTADPTCNGVHLQHAWLDKGYVETRVRDHILQDMLLTLTVERRPVAEIPESPIVETNTKSDPETFLEHRRQACDSPSIPFQLTELAELPETHIVRQASMVADMIQQEAQSKSTQHKVPTAILFLSDSKYEARFEEIIKTWSHFADKSNLVMAALDEATEAYFQERGIKTVRLFPEELDGGERSVREAVLRAKVEVPYVLLLGGMRVVMVEMDIYCRSNPLRLDDGLADLLVAEHDYCEEVNVGFWIAYPTCSIIDSFRRMRAWATNPNRTHAYCDGAFDQKLMHYAWLGNGALSAGSHSACRDFAQRDQVFDPHTDKPVALERISVQHIKHWAPPWDPRPDPETWPDISSNPMCVHIWSGFGPPKAQIRYGYGRQWFPDVAENEVRNALGRLDAQEKKEGL